MQRIELLIEALLGGLTRVDGQRTGARSYDRAAPSAQKRAGHSSACRGGRGRSRSASGSAVTRIQIRPSDLDHDLPIADAGVSSAPGAGNLPSSAAAFDRRSKSRNLAGEKLLRRSHAKISIIGDLGGSTARSFAQISSLLPACARRCGGTETVCSRISSLRRQARVSLLSSRRSSLATLRAP